MQEILRIMNELQNTSSRNEKEDLLDIYKSNELFKTILQFVYNPFIVTGLSNKKMKKKITSKVSLEFDYDLDSIEEVMKYLQQHNTGRDMDIANIQDFILRQPEDQRDLFEKYRINDN